MKRYLSLILALVIIISSGTIVFSQSTDYENSWAKKEIEYLMERDIIKGYPDGTFKPSNNMSKAEFYKLVNDLMGYTEKAEVGFQYVTPTDWFYEEVQKGLGTNYIQPKELINPKENITRGEVARIVGHIFDIEEDEKVAEIFTDNTLFPKKLKGIIGGLKKNGFINGFSDGSFRPQSEITRAEVVKMLYDIAGGMINKSGVIETNMKTNVIVNTSGVELNDILIDSIIIRNPKLKSVIIDNQQGLIKLLFENTSIDNGKLTQVKPEPKSESRTRPDEDDNYVPSEPKPDHNPSPIPKTFNLTFIITDGEDPIEGAEVTIGEKILTTDENGEATVNLTDGTYNYSATAEGFNAITDGQVVIDGEAVVEVVSMTATALELVSSFYGLVTYAKVYNGRMGKILALDIRIEEEKLLSCDEEIKEGDRVLGLRLDSGSDYRDYEAKVNGKNLEGTVVKVEVDKDNKPTAVEVLASKSVEKDIELTESHVEGYRLQNSTIIFYDYGEKTVRLGEAEGFTKIKYDEGKGIIPKIYYIDDKIVAIFGEVGSEEGKEIKTDLVTRVRRLANGAYEFTFANGDGYITQEKIGFDEKYEGEIVELELGKETGLVFQAKVLSNTEDTKVYDTITVDSRSTGARTIIGILGEDTTKTYELVSGAKLYDITDPDRPKTISLIDLGKGDKIKVYYVEERTTRFVRFVVRTELVEVNNEEQVQEPIED